MPPSPATLEAFEHALARQDSATLALEEWCAARAIAHPATITAEKDSAPDDAAPAQLAETLQLGPQDTPAQRKVRLACGSVTLSIAWNWFVPARMTPDMVRTLQTTNVPFGKVASPLRFRRIALKTVSGRAAPCPHGTISSHRALLVLPDERPLALVLECYTEANLRSGRMQKSKP